MENENSAFAFLSEESSKNYFADTDFALRQGRHIANFGVDSKIWRYLNDYHENLAYYYEYLYRVYLRKETSDQDDYYYLEFGEDNRGKFGYDRSRELDAKHVLFGILLLNLFKERFFENKDVKWAELESVIHEGEQRELWQKLLFGEAKRNYTPEELNRVKEKIRRTLNEFEKLAWISWYSEDDFHFEILPGIDRIARLYKENIEQVELLTFNADE